MVVTNRQRLSAKTGHELCFGRRWNLARHLGLGRRRVAAAEGRGADLLKSAIGRDRARGGVAERVRWRQDQLRPPRARARGPNSEIAALGQAVKRPVGVLDAGAFGVNYAVRRAAPARLFSAREGVPSRTKLSLVRAGVCDALLPPRTRLGAAQAGGRH